MSGLVTFYENCLAQLGGEDAISVVLRKEKVDEATIFSLIEECQSLSIETPQECLDFYEKVLSLIFFIPFSDVPKDKIDPKVRELLAKGKKRGYWSSFQLQTACASLASYLVTGKWEELVPRQLEKGGVLLESGGRIADGNIIRPRESVYLALIWIYLGWANKAEELFHAGLRLAQFCTNFCDSAGEPFEGLWMKESEYHPETFRTALTLLFSVTSHFQSHPKMQPLQEKLEKKIEKDVDKVDPIVLLLAMKLKELIERKLPYAECSTSPVSQELDASLGFLRYDYKSLSLACSACGVNAGLGSVHKKGIHIASFGPHYYPLADSNCYGIYRTSNGSREGFRDLTVESHEKGCQLKGWTRIISPVTSHISKQNFSYTSPGDQWLFFDIVAQEENVTFDIRVNKCVEESPLAFAFFIVADRANVQGEKSLIPGSLNRYQGECASLTFEKEGETLSIHPKFSGEMQVIPLAGKHHFWSAEFLLVFPITEKLQVYSWNID